MVSASARTMLSLFVVIAAPACGGDGDEARPETEDSAGLDTADAVEDESVADGAEDASDGDAGEVSPPEPWYRRAVLYEIFVRSFQDSDGDGVGDLRGLVSRLDYLNDGAPGGDDLEVDGIWLMPIQPSPSYHGYDVTDYEGVEPDYGTLEDLEALVAACEARGIRLVMDYVMNHSSREHPWFVDASAGPQSARRDFYVWREDDPGWTQPFGSDRVWHRLGAWYYYGVFWSGMPDLNYRTEAVREAMTATARGWLSRGFAGFRLDAARYLVESADGALFEQPETHAFWRELRAALGDDAYLVGEVWADTAQIASYYGDGEELHQAFAFDLMSGIERAAQRGQAAFLRSAIGARQTASSPPWSYAATFLSNHDLDRLAFRLNDLQLRVATALLLTLPGTPYLYYGDEIGLRSSPAQGDQAKRGPMPWTAAADAQHGFSSAAPWIGFSPGADARNVASASADPASLLSLTRALIRLRREHPALSGDGLALVSAAEPEVFAMLRHEGESRLLVVANLDDAEVAVGDLDLGALADRLPAAPREVTRVFSDGGADPGAASVNVGDWSAFPTAGSWAPAEVRIWRLD